MADVSKLARVNYRISGGRRDMLLLYHVTDWASVSSIRREGRMRPGLSGMFGPGIYFAESSHEASRKAHKHGAIIKALVHVGRMLVLDDTNSSLSPSELHNKGFNSVKAVEHLSGVEYIVYNSEDVIAAWDVTSGGESLLFYNGGRSGRCPHDGCCTNRDYFHFLHFQHRALPILSQTSNLTRIGPICGSGCGCTRSDLKHYEEYAHPRNTKAPIQIGIILAFVAASHSQVFLMVSACNISIK